MKTKGNLGMIVWPDTGKALKVNIQYTTCKGALSKSVS